MSDSPGGVSGTTPGERLRVERERRGFSTQKVAEQLHVDAWVVEALESGRHETLGPPVYIKGHLRKYATLLGLDAQELVQGCTEQADPPLHVMRPAIRTRRPIRIPVKPLLTAAAVVVALCAAVWGYRTWRASAAAGGTGTEVSPVAVPAPEAQPPGTAMNVALTPSQSATATGTERAAARGSTARAGEGARATRNVRVRLSFSADSWVELYDANQRRVFFDLGVANSARSFTIAAPARVFLGYADAVQVELDGRPVALSDEVRRGNVAHFTIDTAGRLEAAGSLAR